MTVSLLDVRNLTVRHGTKTIVNDVCFEVKSGQWLMVVGPNGAGKSTIVNAISKGVAYTGDICFSGTNITVMRPSEMAKNIGVLAQSHNVSYSFTVEEVVKLGRYAYSSGIFSTTDDNDEAKIRTALERTGMYSIRSQSILTLSGGELQRTFLAQVFAQDPRLLILDEPTNHLDLLYQKQIFELISDWVEEPGRAVISVVHDLSLAKAFGTDAILLSDGSIAASGSIDEVLTNNILSKAYSMDVYQWMEHLLTKWQE